MSGTYLYFLSQIVSPIFGTQNTTARRPLATPGSFSALNYCLHSYTYHLSNLRYFCWTVNRKDSTATVFSSAHSLRFSKENGGHISVITAKSFRSTTEASAARRPPGQVQDLPLYDVDMVVDEDHLPPAGVLLSSNLAYKVIRLLLTTGIISLRSVAEY